LWRAAFAFRSIRKAGLFRFGLGFDRHSVSR
jgi:hypothetical protein